VVGDAVPDGVLEGQPDGVPRGIRRDEPDVLDHAAAAPVQGRDGNFYGTSTIADGGTGGGTVYKITLTGTFSVLYNFDYTHGASPIAPLIVGNDGNFYGTTATGGTDYRGTVFKITPTGALTVMYNFDGADGNSPPYSPLVQGSDGNFYGTTFTGGGPFGTYGNIFEVTPEGVATNLYSFVTPADAGGVYPTPRVVNNGFSTTAGLLLGSDGNFYGVTSATFGRSFFTPT